MSAEAFLDTNVLVYCFQPDDPEKQRIALRLVESALSDGTALISTQVVQEFLSLATRRFASAFTTEDLRAYLDEVLAPLCKVFPDAALYRTALEVREEVGCSFYDALVITGALLSGCTKLYSEDMQDGRTIRGLVIRNPFRAE